MKEIKKPKYILFDVGNVLLYKITHEDENVGRLLGMTRQEYRKFLDLMIEEQTKEENKEFQNINTVEKEKTYLDNLHKKMCLKLKIPVEKAFIDKMTKSRMNGDFSLKDGVLDTLKKLSGKYRLGIFSNALPSRRYHELRIQGLYKFFEHIFISHEIGLEKPNPESYKYVLDKIGCNIEDVLFIDDKKGYLDGAKKAGINNLIMLKHKDISDEYLMINNLGELIKLLG